MISKELIDRVEEVEYKIQGIKGFLDKEIREILKEIDKIKFEVKENEKLNVM